MTSSLSSSAKEFLQEDHVGVVGTVNPDGSSHLTTMWYLFEDNGTVIMSTQTHTKKLKNLRRDPRIAFCVGDGARSVSLYGRVTISQDPGLIRQTIERQVERYVKGEGVGEGVRQQVIATLVQQPRVVLSFTPDKVSEFSTQG